MDCALWNLTGVSGINTSLYSRMEQIEFAMCLRTVYIIVASVARIIWCSVAGISDEPCITWDMCDAVRRTVWNLFIVSGKKTHKIPGYRGRYFNVACFRQETEDEYATAGFGNYSYLKLVR
jgi:hypothetical protein